MALQNTDLDKIRTIAENIAPHGSANDQSVRHLAQQMIQLCNILTGDDVEIIDPKKIGGLYNQEAAVARFNKAAEDEAKKILGD